MKKNSKVEPIRLELKNHIENAAEIEALIMTMAGNTEEVTGFFDKLRNEYACIGNLVAMLHLIEGGKK